MATFDQIYARALAESAAKEDAASLKEIEADYAGAFALLDPVARKMFDLRLEVNKAGLLSEKGAADQLKKEHAKLSKPIDARVAAGDSKLVALAEKATKLQEPPPAEQSPTDPVQAAGWWAKKQVSELRIDRMVGDHQAIIARAGADMDKRFTEALRLLDISALTRDAGAVESVASAARRAGLGGYQELFEKKVLEAQAMATTTPEIARRQGRGRALVVALKDLAAIWRRPDFEMSRLSVRAKAAGYTLAPMPEMPK